MLSNHEHSLRWVYAMTRDVAKPKKEYEQLFAIWKPGNPDPSLPQLQAAKKRRCRMAR